jgi:cell division protein FtsB
MKNFQEKKGLKVILQSRPVLAILGIVSLVFAWNVINLVGKMEETTQNKKIAEGKITELQKEKNNLLTEIGKLNTDSGREEDIREKFGLVKEGEGLVVVVDDQNNIAPAPVSKSGVLEFLKRIFR